MKVFNNILRLSCKDNNICLSLTLANESSAIEVQVQGFPFHKFNTSNFSPINHKNRNTVPATISSPEDNFDVLPILDDGWVDKGWVQVQVEVPVQVGVQAEVSPQLLPSSRG